VDLDIYVGMDIWRRRYGYTGTYELFEREIYAIGIDRYIGI
jgi:hypothetical protein